MKIGILTHQYINNYGAFLQAWALREAIAELFPNDEVQIIDYVNLKHFIINAGGWFRFYKNRESFKDWMEKIKLPRTFAKARNQEMILSKRCFNAKQINALDFDCIIVGSDEVWNYKDTKGNAALKFGEGLTCKNLIAYAPSVGKTAADECVPEYVIRGIKKFKKISARDDLTEQLVCNITGTAPERVLDPTFLAEFPRAELAAKKKPYILFYYCENLPHNILNQIFSYAKEHILKILHERERKALICFSALERQEEKLSEEKAEIVKQRVALYEQYANGNISKEEFIRQRDAYRVQEDDKMEQIQMLRTEKDQIFLPVRKDADNLQTVVSAAEEAGDVMHLSQNVVETFIDRIEVFNDERVKIRFTFEDALNSYEEK